MEIFKVIAVILAVFLHRGNGRVITSASNDSIEKILGIVEVKLNTTLDDTNAEKPSAPVGVLKTAEPDLSVLQLFGDDVSGEPDHEESAHVIPATGASHEWRHKRDLAGEPGCYTGNWDTVTLPSGKLTKYRICKTITSSGTACASSMDNNNNQRKCIPSNFEVKEGVRISTTCSCAP